ncbi:MAG: hypothetical protein KKF62_15090 [Bacteroidetes bacterium]|nr:hypothetical protein [Bacteroidota bacterium]MBU1116204.1 hypothetical protein [Bacteroidota bacterium]MBU1799878.1 hypothetical protein [Bacteroidota bacterium]
MNLYSIYITLHIIFAGIWLAFFAVEFILRGKINKGIAVKENVSNYLMFTNVFGIAGSIGILITGILLVLNSGYGFFDMTSNHWLAAKQIILVAILGFTGGMVIPAAKKIRKELENNVDTLSQGNLNKIFKVNLIINILVLINILFAITHRFYS